MSEKNRKLNVKKLAMSAVMISLSAALSMVRVAEMPLGGSVTLLSMLPVCMLSIMYGCRWGLLCGFLYSLTQLVSDLGLIAGWGLSPAVLAGCVLFDYLAAFTVLGFSGVFRRRGAWGAVGGIAFASFMRIVSHVISGVIFFAGWTPEGWSPLSYSLCYNLAYMLPETVFTAAGAIFLLKERHVSKLFRPELTPDSRT